MLKPHATRPFPGGFFDNAKLKKQHVFTFDILCRHLDTSEDNWIRTDSRTMIRLLKKVAGLNVQTPRKILTSLQEWGYIQILEPTRSRTSDERNNHYTSFAVRVLESAWDPKPVIKAHSSEQKEEYMRLRNERRKALRQAANL
jgi:hypothetical protein